VTASLANGMTSATPRILEALADRLGTVFVGAASAAENSKIGKSAVMNASAKQSSARS
jgi:hypothetical protein